MKTVKPVIILGDEKTYACNNFENINSVLTVDETSAFDLIEVIKFSHFLNKRKICINSRMRKNDTSHVFPKLVIHIIKQ